MFVGVVCGFLSVQSFAQTKPKPGIPSVKRPLGMWVPIGPEAISSKYRPQLYANGRATVVAINPLNDNDVWLGTAGGGVWRSENISDPNYQWTSMTDSAPSFAVGAILLESCSAVRCNTVWVGTGENAIRR